MFMLTLLALCNSQVGCHMMIRMFHSLYLVGKRGMRITLAGLFANVGLTVSKGIAGW